MSKFTIEEVLRAEQEEFYEMIFPEYFNRSKSLIIETMKPKLLKKLKDFILKEGFTERFQFNLVGSILDDKGVTRDIDLATYRKKGVRCTVKDLQVMLLKIRLYARYDLNCNLDIFFRTIDEIQLQQKISNNKYFRTWVISNPFQKDLSEIKTVGKLWVVTRKLSQTNYYKKLPYSNGTRILRPSRPFI